MKLNFYIRFQLLMLFALLQCVAPLAHAHVNGDNGNQSVHIDISDLSQFGDHYHPQESDEVQISADDNHSATVCMPPEFRSSKLVVDQPMAASQYVKVVSREYGTVAFDDNYQQTLFSTPYHHPFSQAPPASMSV